MGAKMEPRWSQDGPNLKSNMTPGTTPPFSSVVPDGTPQAKLPRKLALGTNANVKKKVEDKTKEEEDDETKKEFEKKISD